jgi:hypothetical protein
MGRQRSDDLKLSVGLTNEKIESNRIKLFSAKEIARLGGAHIASGKRQDWRARAAFVRLRKGRASNVGED